MTHEQFLDKLKLCHEDIIVPVEKYISSNTTILFKCTYCETVFKLKPSQLFKRKRPCLNTQCEKYIPKNRKPNKKESPRKLSKEYINNTYLKNTTFEVIEYSRNKQKAVFICVCCKSKYETHLQTFYNKIKRGFVCGCNIDNDFEKLPKLVKDNFLKHKRQCAIKSNHKYDYSYIDFSKYTSVTNNVQLRCRDCGCVFTINFQFHISNNFELCPVCKRRISIKKYYEKLKLMYKRNYTIIGLFKGIKYNDKIILKCKKCGKEYNRSLNHFLNYFKGCQECDNLKIERNIKCSDWSKNTNVGYLKKTFYKKYNDIIKTWTIIDCSYEDNYIIVQCKSCFTIKKLDLFSFLAIKKAYLRCGTCKLRMTNFDKFLKKANKLHGNNYNYSSSFYIKMNELILIKCNKCNKYFYQTPISHTQSEGCSCQIESKGEKIIRSFLNDNYILYTPQKTFDGCVNLKKLRFDFYLPKINTCIEFQGEQHYKSVDFFGGIEAFKESQKRDQVKRNFCNSNNIKLVEIPYWCMDRLDSILDKELNIV